MTKFPATLSILFSSALLASAKDYVLHSFQKIRVTDQFWAEGANFGDFNHDGKNDVVSGPYWYEGPDFKKKHEYAPATQTFKLKKGDGTEATIPGFEGLLGVNNAYSRNFFAFAHDINGDQWTDILILGFPGEDSSWSESERPRRALETARCPQCHRQ